MFVHTVNQLKVMQGFLLFLTFLLSSGISFATEINGFKIEDPLIPQDQIHHGGPPRDGIPALDNPKFVSEDKRVKPKDKVLGINFNGIQKAYAIGILNHHEIVNDVFDGVPVVVSFCPLCGTGMAYKGEAKGKAMSFGVSGLLYNSDVLMYDRETESLWSQILGRAVTGESKGTDLEPIALEHTTWETWQKRFPASLLLSSDTGYARNYRRTPYVGYEKTRSLYFPVAHEDKRYHPKEVVIGVTIKGVSKAYPFIELGKVGELIRDKVGGQELLVYFDAKSRTARVEDRLGNLIYSLTAYWFAWYAFHPDTEVFSVEERAESKSAN